MADGTATTKGGKHITLSEIGAGVWRQEDRNNRPGPSGKIGFAEPLLLFVAAAVLVVFRLHAFDVPLETDECNYIYIAGRLLNGGRLYVDVWDHQPFGVFVLFAGAMALFGDGPDVFRWLALAFSLTSLVLIYGLVRRAAGIGVAIMAASLFALASSDPGTAGEGCNREIFMSTFILGAWSLVLRPSRRLGTIFVAGVLLAAASTLKTIVAVHWLWLGIWLAIDAWRGEQKRERAYAVFRSLVAFALGPVLIWATALVYFASTDRLAAFVDAVFIFNLGYSERPESFLLRFWRFFTPVLHPFVFSSAPALWIGAIVAIAWLAPVTMRRWNGTSAAILALLIASYLAVCLPGQFWPHYYYLLVPPVIAVLSVALRQLAGILGNALTTRPSSETACFAVVAVLVTGWLLATQYRDCLSQPPFGLTVKRYNGRDFWGRAQGENVRRVTRPDDLIFVYGNDAEIYYYAQRQCASRYSMVTGLRSGYPGYEERRELMLQEIAERRPRLILVVLGEESFPEWSDFLLTRYDPVGYDFRDRPPHDPILMVLGDRQRPIEAIDWNWDRVTVGGWNLGESP